MKEQTSYQESMSDSNTGKEEFLKTIQEYESGIDFTNSRSAATAYINVSNMLIGTRSVKMSDTDTFYELELYKFLVRLIGKSLINSEMSQFYEDILENKENQYNLIRSFLLQQ